MFNTINNMSRKPDKYGDLHFISFLGSVLARLAYLDDNKFLNSYNSIMGPIIHPQILQGINKVGSGNLSELLDDQKIFGLNKGPNDIFKNYEYQFNGKNYIDFIGLNMPQNVNIINGDLQGNKTVPVPGQPTPSESVKYISIGWSNYGEIYVVADKRMPNTLFLLFRGTYSAKTAALYSKPTSIVPLTVCNDSTGKPEQFLYGIIKPTSEMIHTIIESMRYLATDFLGATQMNSVKIFTTGHSLGGAMCTDFTYLWMGIKKTAPYNAAPYNVLADNIICISLGSPRCLSSSVAQKFCNFVKQKKILFLRITTRGDPVPALPPKTGFQHPCSDDDNMRKVISEDCNETLIMRPAPNVNYAGNLDCQNYKTRAYIPNVLSHTIYLDILYTKAVDVGKFLKGIGIAQEVLRGPGGSTICRLIMGQTANYKVIFFDVNKAREVANNLDVQIDNQLNNPQPVTVGGGFFDFLKPKPVPVQTPVVQAQAQGVQAQAQGVVPTQQKSMFKMPKLGGKIAEDIRMTKEAFNMLIQQMVPLQGNLCPQKGQMSNPFNNQTTPDLSCPSIKFGIGGNRRYTRKPIKNKKQKSKKHRRNKSRKY